MLPHRIQFRGTERTLKAFLNTCKLKKQEKDYEKFKYMY